MIPRLHFAHLPTPVEPLPRLTRTLQLSPISGASRGNFQNLPRLFVKRDDQTGLALGGNKTRKLEFLVAEAQEQRADTLITAGAAQSNHCRQTAAAAARFGFECVLVLTGEPPKRASANLLLDGLFGARIVWADRREDRDRTLQETFEQAKGGGKRPYLVPYGGSNPTGALGYAFAMEELMAQKPCGGRPPDWIVFASSSAGTQAGLALGARLFGFRGRLLGISVDEPRDRLQVRAAALATEASEKFGKRLEFSPEEILVNDEYCQAGYGVLTEAERQAIRLFAQSEGLLLDPVYTGRAAAGLIDLARKGWFGDDETVLFWHTGGQPALFAETYRGL